MLLKTSNCLCLQVLRKKNKNEAGSKQAGTQAGRMRQENNKGYNWEVKLACLGWSVLGSKHGIYIYGIDWD